MRVSDYKNRYTGQDEITIDNTLEQVKSLYEQLIDELFLLHKESISRAAQINEALCI